MKILITYVSEYGTTKSIAEHMYEHISALDIGEVILTPITENPSLHHVDAVIVGSCIHMMDWIPAGFHFIEHELADFQKKSPNTPIWAFSVGMPSTHFHMKETEAGRIERWLKKYLQIREHMLFEGEYHKEGMPVAMKVAMTVLHIKMEDRRDWKAIDAWTNKLAADLKEVAELKPQEARRAIAKPEEAKPEEVKPEEVKPAGA
ncbi:Fc.00g022450.m01.CDS01 [Cosmosporella sp. VM-42]